MSKESFFTDLSAIRKAYYEHHYYKENKSWSEIAKMLGTYPNRVRRDAQKLGVKSRDKSEAQKIAISEGRHDHPTKGKKRTDETKLKISESQGKVWDSMSEQDKEYRSKIGLESWNKKTPQERSEFFKKSSEAVQLAARQGSKTEHFLFESMIDMGYRVEKHKEHILQNEKFHIDLYIPSCRVAIEVDGPMHFEPVFGEEKLRKRMAADSQKNGLILSSGMVLIRVKLNKRDSQRYSRNILDNVMSIVKQVENNFPKENERYFEV